MNTGPRSATLGLDANPGFPAQSKSIVPPRPTKSVNLDPFHKVMAGKHRPDHFFSEGARPHRKVDGSLLPFDDRALAAKEIPSRSRVAGAPAPLVAVVRQPRRTCPDHPHSTQPRSSCHVTLH
jgi:hypothetical protein